MQGKIFLEIFKFRIHRNHAEQTAAFEHAIYTDTENRITQNKFLMDSNPSNSNIHDIHSLYQT